MSKVFWKEYEKVQKLSEEAHEKIVRQIFPNATDDQVNFIVCDNSNFNPISYEDWCRSNLLEVGDEESYDPYSRRAREVINDPNPLGRATSCELMFGIIVANDEYYRHVIRNHEYAMGVWERRVASERRKFERTLKAWVGLFVPDPSISEHYYQVISHTLSPYSIRERKPKFTV